MKKTKSFNFKLLVLIAASTLLTLSFIGSQVFVAWEYKKRSQDIQKDLAALRITKINEEKTRQEIIKLRLENEQQTLFIRTILVNLSSTVGVIVALSGAWVGLTQYFGTRRKEQLDRLANDLNKLWDGLTSDNQNARAGSIAGLQHFLSPDKKEFYERVGSALALVGRLDDNTLVVQRTLTPVVEYAMKQIPDVMRNVSWQGVKLYRPDFSGFDLSGFDLRDCDLKSANFSHANLSKAKCNAAQFSGAIFDNAVLCDADLEFADFGNASLKNADLRRANLYDVKIMNMNLEGAKLQGAKFLTSTMDWRLSRNWRLAEFDTELKEPLLKRYGPNVSKPRILMLLWEFFPVVSGGAWTAAYHLIKNLRMKGADLIVMVPWTPSAVSYYEFGCEVELIPVGIEQPSEERKKEEEVSSPYGWMTSAPENSFLYDPTIEDRTSTFDMVNQFTQRICKVVEQKQLKFDVIHAHDWITFKTAESLAQMCEKPWIAHFHSIENDRREERRASSSIRKIEQRACQEAAHIITPSKITKQRIVDIYNIPENKVSCAPNCLSDDDSNKIKSGEFSSSKVVFIGRLTWQKGPDTFVDIAREVIQLRPNAEFVIFGKGDMENELKKSEDSREVYIPAPEVIKGTQGDKLKILHQFIEFEEMVPINYVTETDSMELLRDSLSDKQCIRIGNLALERGFTAHAGEFEFDNSYYSHRIVINDLADDLHTNYLVKAKGLKKIEVTTTTRRLVSCEGFKDWHRRKRMFENATLVIVPSRFEPFGMVILEAMQEGVPVMYSNNAGVTDVIKSGIPINQGNVKEVAQQVVNILNDKIAWQRVVEAQTSEIVNYRQREYESIILSVWKGLTPK